MRTAIDSRVTLFTLLKNKCQILPSPHSSGIEIFYIWHKIKTTVFASCYHRRTKTQWPLAMVWAMTLLSLSTIYNTEHYTPLDLGAIRAERQY